MTLAEAITAVSRRVQAQTGDTKLTDDELIELLNEHKRWNTYAASTAYVFGAVVRLSGASDYGRLYRCIAPGTSGATAPNWPTAPGFLGLRILDGPTLIWEDAGPDHLGQWDLSLSERDAWLLLASKVEGEVDFSDPDASIKASQEAAAYRRRANLKQGTWVV